ncbi:MAG: HlyD family efflux transporter periplasmic adaptor subunit [Gammaproteobacteria bacterium]|nr:HlyD family efflux transporter periplasmic adaptor subunit [Gammaproteobacteria bacterium]MDH3508152.1 HlyD family efflux transporter periplasmic adaptor subunit [Gammaproteobacteria bacterium]
MTVFMKRLTFWGSLVALLVIGLAFAFRPRAIVVDMTEVRRGELVVTVNDEGRTRVHDIYVLSAPVAGHMRRIDLHAGDVVVARETVVAEIEPIDPAFLDPRSEAQAIADVRAAESAEALARATIEQAEAELEFARREHDRATQLIEEGTISQRERDDAEREYRTKRAALATALAALDVRSYELERARAALVTPADSRARAEDCACVAIRAPVDGSVLRILQQSEAVVTSGTPLIEIGDPRDLEIVVDLLSSDAVSVAAGQRVLIERWGGETALEGRVRLVEPYGFTKVSALGIEEQRVNVIIDLTSPTEEWARLAHGYQVELRIILWEAADALKLPMLALFRDGEDWAVFVESGGRAELRHVTLGRRSQLEFQVLDGLEDGERVVLHPSDRVQAGVRIAARGS